MVGLLDGAPPPMRPTMPASVHSKEASVLIPHHCLAHQAGASSRARLDHRSVGFDQRITATPLCASGLDKPQHRCSKCGQSERDSDKSESHSIDHDRLPFILLPGGSGASLGEQDVEAGLRLM